MVDGDALMRMPMGRLVLRMRGGGKAFRQRRAELHEWKERFWRNARGGHKEEIRNLLKKKVGSIDVVDPVHGWTGLHWAAAAGHAEIVKMLIDAGATVNARDLHKSTPLHWAAALGHQSVLSVLSRSGANLHMRDKVCRPSGRESSITYVIVYP